jgi:predicted TPR repeat methyltransferase
MKSEPAPIGRASGPSIAEREWREALRAAGYQVAATNIRVHPSQLVSITADKRAAEAAYRRFVAAEPQNLMALDGLAFLLQHRGAWQEALQVRRQRYTAEARNLGVSEGDLAAVVDFMAASLGDGEQPASAPAAYVAKMFDDAADDFDERLVNGLGYLGPQLLADAIRNIIAGRHGELDILDLGCGTGLGGRFLKPAARQLTGVDLSTEMLRRARDRRLYDDLEQAEILQYLANAGRRFDLIVALEVFNYFGDLQPVLAAITQCLRAGGHCAATVESREDGEYRLRGTRRYQHSRAYLEQCAESAGLVIRSLDQVELRQEQGEPVIAWRGVWQRC